MQPDQLYNQLRFNLEQPYSINKLSVRHKKPQPITIEKAGTAAPPNNGAALTEDQLNAQFTTLKVEKLKEAQFLAQRDLKRQKDELVCFDFLFRLSVDISTVLSRNRHQCCPNRHQFCPYRHQCCPSRHQFCP